MRDAYATFFSYQHVQGGAQVWLIDSQNLLCQRVLMVRHDGISQEFSN